MIKGIFAFAVLSTAALASEPGIVRVKLTDRDGGKIVDLPLERYVAHGSRFQDRQEQRIGRDVAKRRSLQQHGQCGPLRPCTDRPLHGFAKCRNERRDDWRADFLGRFYPLVKDCKSAGEAAQVLNREVFKAVDVAYHASKRPKPDQSPYESIEAHFDYIARDTRYSEPVRSAASRAGGE